VEGASFVNAFKRSSARELAEKLPHPTSTLDEQTARLIAISQGIGDVITGTLNRRDNGYELSVEALDAATGKMIAGSSVTAATKDDLLLAIPKLAAPIRKALGDTTPASVQVDAARGSFTASSLEVVHLYGEGMEQQGSNLQGALQAFSQAVKLDPDFSRAYAGLASVEGNLGQTQAAEKDIKLALEHVDHMTERERYRVRGLYYARTGDWQNCIEENSELVRRFPSDDIGHNNLAYCYRSIRNYKKAIDELKQVLAILPKNQLAHTNLALFDAYAGDAQASQAEARQLLSANPSAEFAYVALAYAQVEGHQVPQGIATYRQLERLSAFGQSMAVPGLADIAVYEGRYQDAAQLFEQGATADVEAKRLDSAAADFAGLADVRLKQGQKAAALQAVQKALASSKSPSVLFHAGRIYAATGEFSQAREMAAKLSADTQPESQAFGKLIEGEATLQEGDSRKAVEIFATANNQLDTWLGHFDLGRAYLLAGLLVQADSEFDKCGDRSGETLDLFDYVPTYGYVPDVYYYQGKTRQGMNSPGYVDSYAKYLSIHGAAGEDPLLAEVRRGMTRQERN
jgi:tetratricopeptide (TPR) repeat protein